MEERYGIREVARLTGLSSATLRKWEERYQIVQPTRLPNGYREYTRNDLETLLWIKSKVDGGALVSTAASDWKERLASGWKPDAPAPRQEGKAPPPEVCQQNLLSALLDSDPTQVTATFNFTVAGFGLERTLSEVVQPILYEVGRLWEAGQISEYQEHIVSMLLRNRLLAMLCFTNHRDGPLLINACMPGEQHEIGSIILGLLAVRQGFRVIHMGPSPSPEGLREALVKMQPAVLAFSVTMVQHLKERELWLKSLAETARRQSPNSLLVVGGQAVTARGRIASGVRGRGRAAGRVQLIPGNALEVLSQIHQLLGEHR